MVQRKRPVSHPGIYVKDAIEAIGMSEGEFASKTGLSTNNVLTLIKGESDITPEIAIKLAAFFHNSAEGWINLQTKYKMHL